jgi:hypothetical protein
VYKGRLTGGAESVALNSTVRSISVCTTLGVNSTIASGLIMFSSKTELITWSSSIEKLIFSSEQQVLEIVVS